jgi:hypothetical protein
MQHGAAPPFQPVARRALTLNLKTGAAVGQQHETCGPRDQVSTRATDGRARPTREVHFNELRQSIRPPDDRAETSGAQQIISDTVPPGQAPHAGEIPLGVENIDGGGGGTIVDVERAPRQVLIEIPSPARRVAGRCRTDHSGEGLRGRGIAQTLEAKEIYILVAQGETEVAGESIAGPVSLVKYFPVPLFPLASAHMLFGDATGVPNRCLDVEGADESRPAGKLAANRDTSFLKHRE